MFDKKLVNKNKDRSVDNIRNSDFYQFIYSDLKERLDPVDKNYQKILILGFVDYHMFHADHFHRPNYINPFQLESIEKKSIDLILFPFGLHWIGEVQKFLAQIKLVLKENGVFICNFPGSGSLSFLRKALFLAEESVNGVHFPHISPFIRFDDMTPLLQQAGFVENIIDCETITLEYESPILLMKDLKNFGESNAICNRTNYSITKLMYNSLENYNNDAFVDQVNLISLISSPTKNAIKLKTKYFLK
jgi:NADH dehydrogenase [ubiquinone] 1 alpha subcomplex assembly factor 5